MCPLMDLVLALPLAVCNVEPSAGNLENEMIKHCKCYCAFYLNPAMPHLNDLDLTPPF